MSDFDLNDFYSNPDVSAWKQVLGEEIHYHYGDHSQGEDFHEAVRRAVRNHYPYIPQGASVLDAGCGWGGPARLLQTEHGCRVQCLTISTGQAEYCRQLGLQVRICDLEKDGLEGSYDVAFLFEVLSHIRDKQGLLSRLRRHARRLVLTVNCCADDSKRSRVVFGGSMQFCSVSELEQYVTQAGWKLIHKRERRRDSLPTLRYWKERLEQLYGTSTPPGHLGMLLELSNQALAAPELFVRRYPLVDLVAD